MPLLVRYVETTGGDCATPVWKGKEGQVHLMVTTAVEKMRTLFGIELEPEIRPMGCVKLPDVTGAGAAVRRWATAVLGAAPLEGTTHVFFVRTLDSSTPAFTDPNGGNCIAVQRFTGTLVLPHELGHSLSLVHLDTPGDLMSAKNPVEALDPELREVAIRWGLRKKRLRPLQGGAR
jgi:hypothetical protein